MPFANIDLNRPRRPGIWQWQWEWQTVVISIWHYWSQRVVWTALLILFLSRWQGPASAVDEVGLSNGHSGGTGNSCSVQSIVKSSASGVTLWSPDGQKYLINKKDRNKDYQIFVGSKGDADPLCISCNSLEGAPAHNANKLQARWHPSGQWIIFAGEKSTYNERWLPKPLRQEFLECGMWMDIYAISPDGSKCFKLADTSHGFTGVAFTPDGRRGVWAEATGGLSPKAKFGKWRLKIADFQEIQGVPALANVRDITPTGASWLEPGNFAPNGEELTLNSDIGMDDAQGQDQYILNVDTQELKNLTNSPHIWDEHGVFSPDGKKIFFMSSYPYRDKRNSYKILGLKVDFMLMNADGSDLQQITHFNTPGYPEYYKNGACPAVGVWNENGREIDALVLLGGLRFSDYDVWKITFDGNCGNHKSDNN